MTHINDIPIDKIENDIMSILYANIDNTYTQYSLFNKLMSDKYDFSNTNIIDPNFKSKFLLILRNLISKYDDIKITKNDKIYNIVCLSSQDANPLKFTNNEQVISELNDNDVSTMYDYIYENNMNEYIDWKDPFDGNTIYHELVLNNKIKQIERLINLNVFDYTIMNIHEQTPIDLIKTPQLAKIIIMKLIQEKKNTNTKVDNLKSKIDFIESDKYKNQIIKETSLINILKIKTYEHLTFISITIILYTIIIHMIY